MSEQEKAVLFISPLPPPDGGMQSWTESIVKCGLPKGFRPVIIDSRLIGERKNWSLRRLSVSEARRTVGILFNLISLVLKCKPRIIHLNCCLSSVGVYRDLLCALLARLFKVPLVTHYHAEFAIFPFKQYFGLSFRCLKYLAEISKLNIALNNDSLKTLTDKLAVEQKRAIMLPNFLDDRFLKYEANILKAKERRRIIFVGRISQAKGCREFIHTAARMPEADFVLIGMVLDDMKFDIENKPQNVHVLGPMERDAVFGELSQSDIFFFPSHTEGFPVAVLEAMATGLPVVATRVGAIPEMIADRLGGYLVECGAVEKMYIALRYLLQNPQLIGDMGLYNKNYSRKIYGYSAVTTALVQYYNQILAEQVG